MRLKFVLPIVGVVALAAAAIPAIVAAGPDDPKLIAKPMDGDQEVPGPGDEDGKGSAKVTLKPDKNELCFVVKFSNIDDPNQSHIHKGVEGEDGDIVVTLWDQPQSESPIKDCVDDVKDKLLDKLESKPEKFYVNVHNDEFKDGAIRGQLEELEATK